MNPLMLFGTIGTGELLLILVVALLLFGSRLPEVMHSLGRSVVMFKKGMRDGENELHDIRSEIERPVEQKPADGSKT